MAEQLASSSGKRIVFTGGSGKAGRHAIDYLLSKGHSVLNLDLQKLDNPKVLTLKTDLTDSGQVFNGLTSLFNFSDYSLPKPPNPPDAVIHFAAHARNLLVPDNVTFSANVTSTYNIVEAACKLGVKKVIIASSETVYGVCFAHGDADYEQFPLEEDNYDCNPADSYALSKLCCERIARTFAARYTGTDIYVLRIGNVVEPHEHESLATVFENTPQDRKRNAWSIIDARDLGQICNLCVEKSGLGYQIFNATNSTVTAPASMKTEEVLGKFASGTTKRTRALGEYEAPLSNGKIRELLGFRDEHDWVKR